MIAGDFFFLSLIRMEVTCPQCRRKAEYIGNPFRPFCTERCKLIDLGQWASEKYRVPGEPVSEESLDLVARGTEDEDS